MYDNGLTELVVRGAVEITTIAPFLDYYDKLYQYLAILDVPAPPLYGLTSEELAERGLEEQRRTETNGS